MITARHENTGAGRAFLALCLALLPAAACNGNPAGTGGAADVETGGAFTLAVGETVVLADGALVVRLTEVAEDSRCPTDVVCVWQGDAVAALEVVADGAEHALRLHINPGQATGPDQADVGSYRITFLELAPAPRSDVRIPQDDYRVTLRIDDVS